MTLPTAIVEHQLPGRLRLRIPECRGDTSFFQGIVQALSKHPDIQKLDANPLTGSILIHHSASSAQAITAAATDRGLLKIRSGHPKKARSTAPRANSGLIGTAATGLTGLALLQAARGQVVGNAAENFWHAYGAHRILHRPEVAAVFMLLGIAQVLRGQLFGSASSLFFYSLITRQHASADRGGLPFKDLPETPSTAAGDHQAN